MTTGMGMLRRGLAILSLLFAVQTAQAQALTPSALDRLTLGCDWMLAYDPAQEGLGNTAFPDTAARYWIAVVTDTVPAQSRLRIVGRYPDARYAALHVHDGNLATLDAIAEYELAPNPGFANTFLDTTRRSQFSYGGGYTARVLLRTAVPAQRAPNTLYRKPPGLLDSKAQRVTALVYRTYLPLGGNAGRVPLPRLVLDTPLQASRALADTPDTEACAEIEASLHLDGAALTGSANLFDPVLPAFKPKFRKYEGSLLAGGSSTGVAYNPHNGFLYAKTQLGYGELLLVRGRAESYTSQPEGPNPPQLRYWSLCQAGFNSQKVYACINDRLVPLDAQGYYTVIVSTPAKRPPAAAGFSWLPWGPEQQGVVTKRQLLAHPDFPQAAVRLPRGADPAPFLGEYMPLATYCARAVFDAAVALGPAQTFAACTASRL